MLGQNYDCMSVILSYVNDGRVYKALLFTCKMFATMRYYEYVDKFCNAQLTMVLSGKDDAYESSLMTTNFDALRKLIKRCGISFRILSSNRHVPLDIIEENVGESWSWRQVAMNVNLTPDFVRRHVSQFRSAPYLADHEWMTIEFMKEIGYDEGLWPLSRHYTLDMFVMDWYVGERYVYVPPAIVLDVLRDRHESAYTQWSREVVFEESAKFPLALLEGINMHHVSWVNVVGHPDITWDFVLRHLTYDWDWRNLFEEMSDPLTENVFDHAHRASCEPIHDVMVYYSSNQNANMTIIRKHAIHVDWIVASGSIPIKTIIANSDLPWAWEHVSRRSVVLQRSRIILTCHGTGHTCHEDLSSHLLSTSPAQPSNDLSTGASICLASRIPIQSIDLCNSFFSLINKVEWREC